MIYFDDAATSRYKPPCVIKAVNDSLKHSANPGRGSHRDAIKGAMTVEETRFAISKHANAKRANVVFTKKNVRMHVGPYANSNGKSTARCSRDFCFQTETPTKKRFSPLR